MPSTLDTLLQQIQKQQESATAANLRRYQEALAIYDEIISRYRPGGTFGQAALAQLEKRKVRDVGEETQQLISSGLYGTTTMGATGRRWEEAVGAPERLKLEDIQMQRLSEAQVGKAGFMERREDVGPSSELVAQLAMQAGQAGYGGFGGGGGTIGGGGGKKTWEQMFPSSGRTPTTKPAPVDYSSIPYTGGVHFPSYSPTTKPATSATALPETYGPPTPYYGAGGGWKDWETTGGQVMPAYGENVYIAGMSTEQAQAHWKARQKALKKATAVSYYSGGMKA